MLSLYTKYQILKDRLMNEEEGQTIVEYVLLIVLIALAVFAANPSITNAITNVFERVITSLEYTPT
jgi:Flp pilus assembly pilin Flp